MILADTSAWVEFDRTTGSRVDVRVAQLVAEEGPLAVTEPVIMELLAGARTPLDQVRLRGLVDRFALIRFDSAADFHGAAKIFQVCRAAGFTPLGIVDCMIASVASRTGSIILSNDIDMYRIASIMDIQIDQASFGAAGS